jgi:hypothetical protein
MDPDTCDLIRHLYFVQRRPVRAIAEALALSSNAVRRALVLPGGQAGRRDPAPVATALAIEPPTMPHAPILRRVPGRRP